MANDIKQDHFTKSEFFIYGIVLPLAFVTVCIFADRLTEVAVDMVLAGV